MGIPIFGSKVRQMAAHFVGSEPKYFLAVAVLTEREQNCNQATADMTRPSASMTDQSRVSLPTNSGLVIDTSNSLAALDSAASSTSVSTGTQTTDNAESTSTTSSAEDKPLNSVANECCDDVASERRGMKRYRLVHFDLLFIIIATWCE